MSKKFDFDAPSVEESQHLNSLPATESPATDAVAIPAPKPEPLKGDARDYQEVFESTRNQFTGILAEGHERRRAAEEKINWRSYMQSSGQWKPEQEQAYQDWRAAQIEFWKEFKSLDAVLFRYRWTTQTGQRVWPEVLRLTKVELEIEL